MLNVKTPEEALTIIQQAFPLAMEAEAAALEEALGRVLAKPVIAGENVPGFDRSTVDGYALRGEDTFGCSDALPALLRLTGEIAMGQPTPQALQPGCCMAIPTGGALPPGADAAVMLEYTEAYGDGMIGVCQPVAQGANVIFKDDDAYPGKALLSAGRRLTAADIGALAALGVERLSVRRRPVVGVLSTGDELIPVGRKPAPGQVRDANAPMLSALCRSCGADARALGVVKDDEAALRQALSEGLAGCDALMLSGGSSVGAKDAACRAVENLGEVLFHGVAMKPGKPTFLGRLAGKPVLGLPGHPAAAFFTASLFLPPLLAGLSGQVWRRFAVPAVLSEAVSANHGRAEYVGVRLVRAAEGDIAQPVRGKSGLIAALAGTDGYFCIPRDQEGAAKGDTVMVTLYAPGEGAL